MKKYELRYSSASVNDPVLSETILKTKVPVNILLANVDYSEGVMVIAVLGSEAQEKKVVNELRKRGVNVTRLEYSAVKDEDKCINCGACINICPTEAITFNKEGEIEVDEEKCICCEICVEACPMKALTIPKA